MEAVEILTDISKNPEATEEQKTNAAALLLAQSEPKAETETTSEHVATKERS